MTEQPDGVGREVLYEVVDDHIAVITLNRPEVRNAVNPELAAAVEWLVKRVEADDAIRVAILTSSNDRVFCAGADLAAISSGRGAGIATKDGGFAGFVDAKRDKPWIAAVKGYALAGGGELCLACDMIVASDDAKFGLPEVKRGLFAGAGGVHRLPRALPRNIALELIATGESLDAQRAYELGLVNRLAPTDGVLAAALELARAISVNAPVSVRESLKVARLSGEATDAELRKLSGEATMRVMTTADAREGPRAFLEKRAPQWTGR
ncbi:MAG: enoyl-CoA hydratase [Phenylobacterium sp.]|nr:enoyl-CoA hydratase [Phenylobacterium sp.]